jgi:hypothetical protein
MVKVNKQPEGDKVSLCLKQHHVMKVCEGLQA